MHLTFQFDRIQDIAERVEEEIAAARQDSSGGFKGVLGEITRAFACLSDPVLLDRFLRLMTFPSPIW